jgi:hypothetical protein
MNPKEFISKSEKLGIPKDQIYKIFEFAKYKAMQKGKSIKSLIKTIIK